MIDVALTISPIGSEARLPLRRLRDRPRHHRRAAPPARPRLPDRRHPRSRRLARPGGDGAQHRRQSRAGAGRGLHDRLRPPRRADRRLRRRLRRSPATAERLEEDPPRIAARAGGRPPGGAGAARGRADDLARPEGTRRSPEAVAQTDEHQRADGRRRVRVGGGRRAGRARAADRRALLPPRERQRPLRADSTSSSSASSATAPRSPSTTPGSTRSATRSPATCSAACGRRGRRRSRGSTSSVVFEAAGRGIEIGGDLYDVLPTDDGCWVLVGDVAGKGSAAAGVSVAVRHAVRGLTREVDEPEEVLARVNELLFEGTGLNDFATAVLVRLRRKGDGLDARGGVRGPPAAGPRAARRRPPARRRHRARRAARRPSAAPRRPLRARRHARLLHRRLARGGAAVRAPRPGRAGAAGRILRAAGARGDDRAPARRRRSPGRAASCATTSCCWRMRRV